MRFLRFLLTCLIILLVLAGVFAAAVFSPLVQTWYVQRQLNQSPNLKASVDSVSAGLSSVEVSNLRLETPGALVTVPQLNADLPTKAAFFDHRFSVRKLVAKGWTLDLSHRATSAAAGTAAAAPDNAPAPSSAPTAPTETASHVFAGILSACRLPKDTRFDEVELEGTVVFSVPSQSDPVRVHIVLIGTDLAPAKTAHFTLDAAGTAANSNVRWQTTVAHGRLAVDVSPAAAVTRLEYSGTLSSEDESLPKDFTLNGTILAGDAQKPETYVLELVRATRRVAGVAAHFVAAQNRFAGDWNLDVHADEIPTFLPGWKLPTLTVAGNGHFDTDPTFNKVHAAGEVIGSASHWDTLTGRLSAMESVRYKANFDTTHEDHTLRVAALSVSTAAGDPIASVVAAQPFTVDERTGSVSPTDANATWLTAIVHGCPLSWLPRFSDSVVPSDGKLTGHLIVKASGSGFAVESQGPLTAKNVTLRSGERILGSALDLAAPIHADYTSDKGWEIHATPLTIDSSGHRLATVTATLHPLSEPYRFASVTGTLLADWDALSAQPGMAALPIVHGQNISAEFTANLGLAADLTAKVNVAGHTKGHSVSATINATIDDLRNASFQMPVQVTADGKNSDFTIEGKWLRREATDQIDIAVESHTAFSDHLRWLAACVPLGRAASAHTPDARPAQPFWGSLVGRLRFELHVLDLGAFDLNEVAGTLGFQPTELRLNGGRASFNPINTRKGDKSQAMDLALESSSAFSADGTLTFDPSAARPYSLKATGGVDGIEAHRLFGQPSEGHPAVLDGRWAVDAALTSTGANTAEIVANRAETFHLTSHAGTLRLLKTSVADALPDAPTPVGDSVAKVGSAVGWLFGVNKDALNRQNRLDPRTESILNFTYQIREIACDQMAIDAVRRADDEIDLTRVSIHSAKERLEGTGRIAAMAGVRLRDRPLTLELKLAVRGKSADQLAATKLLAPTKDADGYIPFRDPIHFGGTLDQVDNTPWHDLLAHAAVEAGALRANVQR